ncbi:hypothetical protein SUGI_0360580 [Cryptomeria japonica]|nr:hypothetical protein SUGI_0360580 [Cryptomeria japonica]
MRFGHILGSQDSIAHSKRLFIPRKELSLPRKWEMPNDAQFNAKLSQFTQMGYSAKNIRTRLVANCAGYS